MSDHAQVQWLGALLFAGAVVHTFLTPIFLKLSHRFQSGSGWESLFHLLSEIEVVFGVWAALFLGICSALVGFAEVRDHLQKISFTEPIFVFVVMVISSTRPVLWLAKKWIQSFSFGVHRILRVPAVLADVFVILSLGPLSGSLITEPAAMTVTALLLFSILERPTLKLMYFALAVLFVNVSIGGALTHFAAPPILMVAKTWGWDSDFIFQHLGWKAALAVVVNSLMFVVGFQKELRREAKALHLYPEVQKMAGWVWVVHCLFLVAVVLMAHYSQWLMALFLFFLGVTTVTSRYQDKLRLRESLLVSFFLGGIIVFGGFQRWWLEPLITGMGELTLFFSSVALTSVTDNAALTYLGSQVQGLSEAARYYLVAGAIAGGGLTVIANAPNAAGLSVLQSKFSGGVNPLYLLLAALPPTLVAILCLEFLPSF